MSDWRAGNGQEVTDDIPDDPKVPSSNEHDIDDLTLLIEIDDGWIQSIGSVDPQLVEVWVQYHGEIVTAKLAIIHSSIDVIKTGCELLAENIDLLVRLDETDSGAWER